MIYRSNLVAPDLRPYFEATTKFEVRPWSMGHEVPSDKEYDPDCCFLTDDEVAILHEAASRTPMQARWVDIGGRTGWTGKHINYGTNAPVECVDPDLHRSEIRRRFQANTGFPMGGWVFGGTAAEYFALCAWHDVNGFIIDGDHDEPHPLNDALGALQHLAETGVIVFHDFWGRPIRQGVEYLMEQGLKCRVYNTPAGMAVCWRG